MTPETSRRRPKAGGNGVQAAKAAYNPSSDRAAHATASANMRKDAVAGEIRRVVAIDGPGIEDALAALRKLHEHKNPRARLMGFDCPLDLGRFSDEPSKTDEAWDFRNELRGRLVEDYPTLEDWFRAIDRLMGEEFPIRVRFAAAERLMRLEETLRRPWPEPGEKQRDIRLRMALADLPMPVLLHMIEAGTEVIPSEREQRRLLQAHWAAGDSPFGMASF